MHYDYIAIPDRDIPRAADPLFQHLLDTYASETDKVISVWRGFAPQDLGFRPHAKSSTVADILKHQLLSERRFFGEFVGARRVAVGWLFALSALLPLTAQQPATGLPTLGSFSSVVFDTINLANLDVHFSIPIFSRPGKGIPFDYALTYDSLIWIPIPYSGQMTWIPASSWGWRTATEAATGWVASLVCDVSCFTGPF